MATLSRVTARATEDLINEDTVGVVEVEDTGAAEVGAPPLHACRQPALLQQNSAVDGETCINGIKLRVLQVEGVVVAAEVVAATTAQQPAEGSRRCLKMWRLFPS